MKNPKPIVASLKKVKPITEERKKEKEEAEKAKATAVEPRAAAAAQPLPAHPAFQIINPIDTILGPIGQFLPLPDYLPNHPSVGLFGKRRTGKSFLLRWLMYRCFRHYPFGKSLPQVNPCLIHSY